MICYIKNHLFRYPPVSTREFCCKNVCSLVAIREIFKLSSCFDYLLVGLSMLPLANAVIHSPNQYMLFLCNNCQNVSVECGVHLWQWTRNIFRFSDVAVAFGLLLYHLPRQRL